MRRRFSLLLFFYVEMSLSLQIPCQAQLESGIQYHKIIWYKISNSSSVIGLVMKDLLKNVTVLYKNVDHSYQIGDDFSLRLHQETREKRGTDCETYRCTLWPPVGFQIQASDYSLPQGCQSRKEEMIQNKNAKPSARFASQAVDMQTHGSALHTWVFITIGILYVCFLGICVTVQKGSKILQSSQGETKEI